MGGFALRTGKYARADVSRLEHPREFWIRVGLQLGAGAIFLVLASRKLFDRAPVKASNSDACTGYATSFDCFMGEHFQSLLFTVLAFATPAAYAFWRWYQRRAMVDLMTAADRAERDDRRDSAG